MPDDLEGAPAPIPTAVQDVPAHTDADADTAAAADVVDFAEEAALLDRAPRLRTVLLSTLTTFAGTGLAVVLFSNAYAAPVDGTDAEPASTAPATQQYATSLGYELERVERDRLKAVAPVAGDVGAAAVELPPLKPVAPAGEAQQYAAAQVAARGWSKKDFACLVSLWNKESGWNAHAGRVNGPYGIPQAYPGTKMAAAGGDWLNDHRVQIRWGLGYIAGRYGTPCGAWASSVSTGSY